MKTENFELIPYMVTRCTVYTGKVLWYNIAVKCSVFWEYRSGQPIIWTYIIINIMRSKIGGVYFNKTSF